MGTQLLACTSNIYWWLAVPSMVLCLVSMGAAGMAVKRSRKAIEAARKGN